MSWGKKLGRLVQGGEIIGLVGELGTGKTCFVRGFAEGIGVGKEAWVRSPTFTLINEYSGRLPVYHIDLYRVAGQAAQAGLNLREYLYGDGVSLVEWFEYLDADEIDEHLEIKIAHRGGAKRELEFIAHGERYEAILARLFSRRDSAKAKGKMQIAE
ncbi:MAG: tRNA (adenosine(37)-N6)-threonylcarbamoyltransferase complex ATPase subunit type 1 TsaE [Deltaproteobacteria bacterium]|nr:tRNA (adenosine(37)-N6)-threonylcarbamoyltransferase complex ATPase subunit type 1 TsaE [Deltaproteobacteria bacterium]